jgi:hypothetical protein
VLGDLDSCYIPRFLIRRHSFGLVAHLHGWFKLYIGAWETLGLVLWGAWAEESVSLVLTRLDSLDMSFRDNRKVKSN